jgi:hypothetical protein
MNHAGFIMTRSSLTLIFLVLVMNAGFCHAASAANYDILFLGNSHSTKNDVAGLLAKLIRKAPGKPSARAYSEPHWNFLAERLVDSVSQRILESRDWTHVILQAQKYSTSGQYAYPTEAAAEWIGRVSEVGAVPVMFPEWPRLGNPAEGQIVHDLHRSIAAGTSACVAPVGLAWVELRHREPALNLHDADGNHSNANGALLTAYVLYQVITGQPAADLPDIPGIGSSRKVQRIMRQAASDTLDNNPPCL